MSPENHPIHGVATKLAVEAVGDPTRVLAGTDCGFATFAGFGAVDADVVYAKLGALVEGARLATTRLWATAA